VQYLSEVVHQPLQRLVIVHLVCYHCRHHQNPNTLIKAACFLWLKTITNEQTHCQVYQKWSRSIKYQWQCLHTHLRLGYFKRMQCFYCKISCDVILTGFISIVKHFLFYKNWNLLTKTSAASNLILLFLCNGSCGFWGLCLLTHVGLLNCLEWGCILIDIDMIFNVLLSFVLINKVTNGVIKLSFL